MTLRYRMQQTSSFLSLLFLLLLFFTLRVAAIMALSVPVFSFNTNFISGIHADDKARGIELLARTYSTRHDSSEFRVPRNTENGALKLFGSTIILRHSRDSINYYRTAQETAAASPMCDRGRTLQKADSEPVLSEAFSFTATGLGIWSYKQNALNLVTSCHMIASYCSPVVP